VFAIAATIIGLPWYFIVEFPAHQAAATSQVPANRDMIWCQSRNASERNASGRR